MIGLRVFRYLEPGEMRCSGHRSLRVADKSLGQKRWLLPLSYRLLAASAAYSKQMWSLEGAIFLTGLGLLGNVSQ
jgi:hypothetical protein